MRWGVRNQFRQRHLLKHVHAQNLQNLRQAKCYELFCRHSIGQIGGIETWVWKDGQSTGTLISLSEISTDGLRSWTTNFAGPASLLLTRTASSRGLSRSLTNFAADGSYSVTAFANGRVVTVTRYDSGGSQLSRTTSGYDLFGRLSSSTDARNGATIFTYNDADLVASARGYPEIS